MLRFIHFGNFLALVKRKLHSLLFKVGLDGQQITRFIYFIILMLYLVYVIHVLSCFWILLGFLWNPDGTSWFTTAGLPPASYKGKESYFEKFESIAPIYVRAIYFTVTTLTTVGYGDIKGITNYELLFQMGLEFIGIAFFSLLMSSINNILVQESKVQDIIDEKID